MIYFRFELMFLLFSMRTPLCCSVQPGAIAAAAIHMACTDHGLRLPTVIMDGQSDMVCDLFQRSIPIFTYVPIYRALSGMKGFMSRDRNW